MVVAMLLALTGCGDETTSNNTYVTQGDNGVYIDNGDGTITYIADAFNEGDTSDGTTGEFDSGDDEVECKSKGYFFCPLTKTCNNTSGSSGTCSGKK